MGEGQRPAGPSPTTQLVLLATVHGDPDGYERAWRFLEYWRPDVITVEISRFSVHYREKAAKGWRHRLSEALKTLPPKAATNVAVARVVAQASLPFEYRVARDWGRTYQVPVKLLDTGAAARHHLPRYKEDLLTLGNLGLLCETGAPGTLEEFVAKEYQRARLARAGKLKRLPDFIGVEVGKRERLWNKRLRRLVTGTRKVVHLGGWEHLVPWPDGGGLVYHLGDLQPFIMLLEEAERI